MGACVQEHGGCQDHELTQFVRQRLIRANGIGEAQREMPELGEVQPGIEKIGHPFFARSARGHTARTQRQFVP